MKNVNARNVARLLGRCNYNDANKEQFKKSSMALLRQVVKEMGLAKGTYDLRWNAGGIAVSGEATLHAENVYVQVSADCHSGILVRWCEHRKDYTGGHNFYYNWAKLYNQGVKDFAKYVMEIRSMAVRFGGVPLLIVKE